MNRGATAIVMVCLKVLGVYSQPDRRKREPEPRHLYQVTTTDKQSMRRNFVAIASARRVRGPRECVRPKLLDQESDRGPGN
jgi:hypothetical protein